MTAYEALIEARQLAVNNNMVKDLDFSDILVSRICWHATDAIKGYRIPARFRK